MRQIFKNSEHAAHYDKHGFITYPLLSKDEVAELLAVYEQMNSGLEGSAFYTSHTSSDVEYKLKVDKAIRGVIGPKLADIFVDYRSVFGFYLVKVEGSNTLDVHLDWQFVDERKHVGFNIWCPLVDVRKENGAVFVLPGSHKHIHVLRGYNTPNPVHFVEHPLNEKGFRTVELDAGTAMIFDLRLLHGAWPNTKPQPRIAVGMVAIPEEAELVHFFADKEERSETRVEVYRMEPQDYMYNNTATRPSEDKLLGVWEDDQRESTIKAIEQHYCVRPSLFSRLFGK